ncbi:hypothetical protein E4U30_006589 [Claviceps sp. LM220 group G6]|nr:hypothetical protein E4U30_006589 [Claviceps sp. LM220 group G6]KAG6113165.1 hypothetical protein E4U31_001588 [Claviceps sp. LM219 group G6]
MDDVNDVEQLTREIAQRETELAHLKARLTACGAEAQREREQGLGLAHEQQQQEEAWKWPLAEHEYERYGRQMIVPKFGRDAQLRLRAAKILLVGAGGLGCPAAAYLAGAGVGTLGLVDGDEVEVSNLHRQIAHSTGRVGMKKVESAITFLRGLNPTISYKAHVGHLTSSNAESILSQYDVVLDCTDHPTSRYLISDACVLLRKPLVSASAFQTSGQLIVLNTPPGKGPCYRCVFPQPPPPDSVIGCGEGGIIGPVVGVMGVLQALEAIKLIARGETETSVQKEAPPREQPPQTMLLFSGVADAPTPPFRSVRMRGKRPNCFACGQDTTLTLDHLRSSMDYVQFCGVAGKPAQLLKPEERISPDAYRRLVQDGPTTPPPVLIDVRSEEHFGLASIPGSINVPISRFMGHRRSSSSTEESWPDKVLADLPADAPIYVVCREGNDSQLAAAKLKELGLDRGGARFVGDIEGGLRAWKGSVDGSLPFL